MIFYFAPFVILCVVLLGMALIRPRLVYEFPYFMGIAFSVFILPQAYALYKNGWGGVYLETTLVMCTLCLGCCWLGYCARPHPGLLAKLNVPVDAARFFVGGLVLVIVGWFFMHKAETLPEELKSDALTGIGTIYLFFGGLVFPGFAICFYCALKKGWPIAWVASAIAAIIPVEIAVYQGRREPTALFLITLGLSLYFVKNIKPSRLVIAGVLIGATIIIPATGEYRSHVKDEGLDSIDEIDFGESFENSFDDNAISELKNATALIAATQVTGYYEYGAGYWNAMVFRFVPAQFVGKELKGSLMIGGEQRNFSDFVESVLGGGFVSGTTPTGIGDSFNQFGYVGCLFFAALGYFFRSFWMAAKQKDSIVAQVLYVQVVTTAMRTVTHETIDFLPGFVYSAIFIGAIAFFAREHPGPQSVASLVDRAGSSPVLSR